VYNNIIQSSTDQTPFYLNYRHLPIGIIRHETIDNPHAEDKVRYLLHLQKVIRNAINDIQQMQRRNVNKR
jgi:hypothetical protein